MKQADTVNTTTKARFVGQGFREDEKGVVIHTYFTVEASSIRPLETLAFVYRMRLWRFDVIQV